MFFKLRYVWLITVFWMVLLGVLHSQSSYDIRLVLNNYDTLNKMIYYDVQLRSSNGNTWGLGGQNYRLYYNSTKGKFQEGVSQLPEAYQAFSLIQHVPEIDASFVDGNIPFASTLGFLNFAIDLNDTNNGGQLLSANGAWLTTTSISFKLKDIENNPCLDIIWGRDGATNAYADSFVQISEWVISNQTRLAIGANYFDLESTCNPNSLQIKIFLQGPYDPETGLMHDKLRAKRYLPLIEPYEEIGKNSFESYFNHIEGGEEVVEEETIFEDKGEHSIVDWIFLELRNKDNPSIVETTRSALLKRNGSVVDIDGNSPVKFNSIPDSFYLSIRHRNHLGVMSKDLLSKNTKEIDFSKRETAVYGQEARVEKEGIMLLWGGNADSNSFLVYRGGGIALPDTDAIFFDVFRDPQNIHFRYNHITYGYFAGDTNMDGEVRYQGGGNDIDDLIFFNIISHPNNDNFHLNFLIKEQIER